MLRCPARIYFDTNLHSPRIHGYGNVHAIVSWTCL